ncbi:MAG: hypothetical protein OXG58_04200 [Gemmatimonadetes bacterium]|nr:hypothetical protein [Gemmatimonadota bacterium]MCY3943662.1 hypothetical protein [Gemmatimonadota bacterium]
MRGIETVEFPAVVHVSGTLEGLGKFSGHEVDPKAVQVTLIGDLLEGLDIFGSTMAAAVERPPKDTSGIPGRGLDWYDISAVRGGSRASTETGEAPRWQGVTRGQ